MRTVQEGFRWAPFEKLEGIYFEEKDFRETLDGGQAFTWREFDASPLGFAAAYEGVFRSTALRAALDGRGSVHICAPSDAPEGAAENFLEYIDAKTDYAPIRETLLKTGDANIAKALKIWPTLRILRQSPAEAIVCFICSSSKRIVQIKQCVALLSEKLGGYAGGGRRAVPSFEAIAAAPLETLRECKLGFRAGYLKKSAEKIVSDGFDPDSLREIPYAEAKKYLTSLSGIGDKVADCILLFGASRFEAFPVDTWIKQAMTALYSTPPNAGKIREFAAERFGGYAGFAQQLIFAAIRKNLF